MDNMQIVGAQVYQVLQSVPKDKYYEIPKKITSLFEKYKDCDAGTTIDLNKSFSEQNISKMAKDIIFAISYNYWLTDKQRKETREKMEMNEEEIHKKYSVENLFKDRNKETEEAQGTAQDNENKQLVCYEEKWYTKIFSKIKKLFGKNK